jgi:hypothetical protein
MALNAIERKILESARRLIKARKQSHICYAIDSAIVRGSNLQEVREAKSRLKNYIHRRLDGYATLGYWLARKRRHDGLFMDNRLQREARVAWIAWMLGEPVNISEINARAFAAYMDGKALTKL